jgi:4-aminobutyrate aminotransferase
MPAVGEVRGLGLLIGIELIDTASRPAAELAEAVLYRCLSHGLSFKTSMGTVLTLSPPLTISAAELSDALDIVEAAIRAESVT